VPGQLSERGMTGRHMPPRATMALVVGRPFHFTRTGEIAMKINEDWLSVVIAFALLILALVGVIGGNWMIF
jgi:hypothetical protein